MQRAVTSPTPESLARVPAATRSASSSAGKAATVAAAERKAFTLYVASLARSSRKAIRRRSATGSRGLTTLTLADGQLAWPHANDRLGGRRRGADRPDP